MTASLVFREAYLVYEFGRFTFHVSRSSRQK
jgi:hypothetical protein